MQNLVRPSAIGLIVLLLLFVCSQAQTKERKQKRWNWRTHQTEVIDYAKKYPVSRIETNLPQTSFEKWLRQTIGETGKVNWEINDCGEQTRTSEDRGRDFPMCVESSAKISEAISLRVNIQYGTFKRGISRGKPVVRSISLGDETGESGADFDKLSELPDELNKIKKALVSFDPNDGVFYISDDKPAGFEDFSEMWIAVKNYKSKGATFPVKKHGGFGYAQKAYKLRNIYFDGKIWTFETEIIEGVSFSFDGKFAKPKLDSHGANVDENVLQGHLIKFVGGKIAAEADSVFKFSFQGE